MNKNLHAVLIGINEYSDSRNFGTLQFAEKDAHDIYETLINPIIGAFPEDNVTLVCGREATTHNLESILFTKVVQREYTDTVIAYFSGHGFIAGELGKAYLASSDVSIEEVLSNPNAGLRMDYVHDHIFIESRAERIIFILDCCHSGAFIPPSITGQKDILTRDLLAPGFFSTERIPEGKGRIALVSSPKGVPSRESRHLQNGTFTHFLVEGLKGEAAEDNGEVTIDSLVAYVRRKMPSGQPTGRYGQDFGRFVIAKVQRPPKYVVFRLDQVAEKPDFLSRPPSVDFPPNPLDFCHSFMTDLMQRLKRLDTPEMQPEIGTVVLNVIRDLFRAESAFVLRIEEEIFPKLRSDVDSAVGWDWIIQTAASVASQARKHKLFAGHHGLLHGYQASDKSGEIPNKNLLIVPLNEDAREFLFIAGVAPDPVLVNEVYTVMLKSLYSATRELTSWSSLHVEARIIDDLKLTYNFVPLRIYNRRFSLFTERLSKALVYFQPVLYLDPEFLHITAWEALARDPETERVPADLLTAAELWGSRFTLELDTHMIWLATTKYREALSRTPELRRAEDIRELSVNVYPRSLMRTAYYKVVSDVIKQKVLPAEKLVLEISEKSPIPDEDNGEDPGEAISRFRDQLEKFVYDFQIGFAIDDFGIGYGSISRLLRLLPNYVKIDRSILLGDHSELTLSYVLSLIKKRKLQASKVVVEGYEEGALELSLYDLYEIGIRYIQGYIVGNVGPDLYRLDKSVESKLRNLLGKKLS
jgi:EAL domain-containing protein (putative c-di-GMP-specific phosphodiesterase class I)